jgi:hypothetical protein
MPITWSTRYTLTQQADKLLIQGKVPSILWPTAASAGLAVLVMYGVYSHREAVGEIDERLACLLGIIWFTAIIFGLWLSLYFMFRRPFILDQTGDQFLQGTKRLCPLSEIGWVEIYGLKDHDLSTWVSLCRVGSGKRIRSFVPIGDAEAFAKGIAKFLRVEIINTKEW